MVERGIFMPRRKKDARGYVRETGTYLGERYDLRAKTDRELDEKIKAKRAEIESGNKIVETNITVREWGRRWVATYKTNVSARTRGLIESRLEKYIYPTIGYMRVEKVRPINCQECLNAAAGKAPDTIKKIAQALDQMFRTARDNGLCRTNPAESMTMPRAGAETTHRSITDRERVILLETAKVHPAGFWVLLLLYSGLRPAESIALTYSDIQDGFISVSKAYDRSTNGIKEPKSKAGIRKVPIIPQLAALIPTDGMPGELIFKNRIGNHHTEKTMYRMWNKFCLAMKDTEARLIMTGQIAALAEAVPPMVPYDLRHTYCTDLEKAGVPINVASKLMGHASISITAKIYTHTAEDMILQAGSQLAAFFSPTFSPITELKNSEKTGHTEKTMLTHKIG